MAKAAKMRQEYDFSSGIRGKYLPRLSKGANVVVLDRDMAKVFPSSKAVNDALRGLVEAERRHGNAKGSARCDQSPLGHFTDDKNSEALIHLSRQCEL